MQLNSTAGNQTIYGIFSQQAYVSGNQSKRSQTKSLRTYLVVLANEGDKELALMRREKLRNVVTEKIYVYDHLTKRENRRD